MYQMVQFFLREEEFKNFVGREGLNINQSKLMIDLVISGNHSAI